MAHVPGTDAYLFVGRSSEISFSVDGDVVTGQCLAHCLSVSDWHTVLENGKGHFLGTLTTDSLAQTSCASFARLSKPYSYHNLAHLATKPHEGRH